ncbi:MAG: sugar phosphate isomerase/epimerase [Planctomycetaceae bacterium]|nr:sugar phosphate isomerase/epimerase [Planctomycetaceae bacterium]
MNRRDFIHNGLLATGLICFGLPRTQLIAEASPPLGSGMKLVLQTYTFRNFNLDEAIQKTRLAGVGYVEIAGGTRINGEGVRSSNMSSDQKKWLRDIMAENNVRALGLGGCGGSTQEFDFAQEMGLQYLQGEPPFEKLIEVSKRAEEYKIRFTVHNHANPNKYWNYKETLKRLDGCTSWIGLCPDTGHQMRSAIDPLVAIKDLKGRIYNIHLKDLNGINEEGKPKQNLHDVPWGTGAGKIEAILTELKAQNYAGTVVIEFEYKPNDNLAEVTECVKFFRKVIGKDQ